jgi:glutamate racemase
MLARKLRPMDTRPIGVFDSGVGGLTVLHECLVTLPHEDFIYFGDSAPERFPYGTKPAATIRRFAHEVAQHLIERDVKLLVVACNSATAAALPDLQREFTVPLIGVITPEAHAAVQATRARRVGVMATEATVASGRYPAAISVLDAGVEVTQVACPELVPLIQSGDVNGHDLHGAAKRYAEPLKQAGVDTVILGCTHYPLIRPMLQRIFGRDVTLITSAEEIAREVAATLERRGVGNLADREGGYRFLCTGDEQAFQGVAGRFLQLPLTEVERIDAARLEIAA